MTLGREMLVAGNSLGDRCVSAAAAPTVVYCIEKAGNSRQLSLGAVRFHLHPSFRQGDSPLQGREEGLAVRGSCLGGSVRNGWQSKVVTSGIMRGLWHH